MALPVEYEDLFPRVRGLLCPVPGCGRALKNSTGYNQHLVKMHPGYQPDTGPALLVDAGHTFPGPGPLRHDGPSSPLVHAPLFNHPPSTPEPRDPTPLLFNPPSSPFVDPHFSPLVDPHSSPFADEHSSPLADEHGSPIVDPHSSPLVDQHGSPLVHESVFNHPPSTPEEDPTFHLDAVPSSPFVGESLLDHRLSTPEQQTHPVENLADGNSTNSDEFAERDSVFDKLEDIPYVLPHDLTQNI